jgi:hypothetical protein
MTAPPLTVDWRALDVLLADACAGIRVHELMRLGYPGDMLFYAHFTASGDPGLFWNIIDHDAQYPERSRDLALIPCQPLYELGSRVEWEDESDLALEHAWMLAQNAMPPDDELRHRLELARAAQARARASSDPLVAYELALMDASRHPLDFQPARQSRSCTPVAGPPVHTAEFYSQLRKLIAQPGVEGATYTGGNDFETVRAILAEKLRRDGPDAGRQSGFQAAIEADAPESCPCAWLPLMWHVSRGLRRTGTLVFDGAEKSLAHLLERAPGEEWRQVIAPLKPAKPDPRYSWSSGNGWSLGVSNRATLA